MSRLIIVFIISTILISCGDSSIEIPAYEKDFCSLIHDDDSISLSHEIESFKDSMQKKTGVYVLEDGGTAMISRAWLTEHAEKTIDIQYFIFATDNVGLIAVDYLVRAADRGVKVRILIDDILVDAGSHEILLLDSHENIEIRIYNPGINVGKSITQKITKFATDFIESNKRMHNKTFIVDDKVAITGGRNVADEYFDYDHEYNFRDRDVFLMGKVVEKMNASFDEFWQHGLSVPVKNLFDEKEQIKPRKGQFDRLHQYACNPENYWPQVREKMKSLPTAFKNIVDSGELIWVDSVDFVSDHPGKNDNPELLVGGKSTTALMELVNSANETIDIQSPYFITTGIGKKLFADAIKRGVKIRILTNSLASTDNIEAFSGYQRDREEILKLGIRVFEFKPDAKERFKVMTGELQKTLNYAPIFGLHAKTMVVDGKVAVIGTFNLDPRSAHINTECVSIIHSNKIADKVLKEMEIEFSSDNSWETTLNFNPDNLSTTKKQIKAVTRKIIPKEIL